MALTTRSLTIFSSLTKSDASNIAWQRGFAEAQTEQAAESLATANADAARAQSQAALAILEPLFSKQPEERAMLLATARAGLQLAAVTADAGTAQRLRAEALRETQSTRSGRGDPRVLALQAEALLGLGRAAEAKLPLERLATSGYRDPGLMSMLQQQHIDYPTPAAAAAAAAAQRLEAPIQ